MSDFFKKIGLSSYLTLGAALAAIVATIIYIVNSGLDYYNNLCAGVLVMSIFAILVCLALPYAAYKFGNNRLLGLAQLAVVIFLAVVIMMSLTDRALSFSYVWFSDLDRDNAAAVFAINQYMVSFAFYLVGLVSVIVSGFFRLRKDL